MANFQSLSNFIYSIADLLRGPYRASQYERVMLPMTVLRRFDAVLAASKLDVLKRHEELKSKSIPEIDAILNNVAKDKDGCALGFHNHSQLDFYKLKGDPDNIGSHLIDYIAGFSENVKEILARFDFHQEIEKLQEFNRLYQVVAQFAEIDLHPERVDNITMGLVFEDLIRRFNEQANETAGDHFTPREVVQLMVNLLLEPDIDVLTQAGVIVTIFDPACGTGGMLAEGQKWISTNNKQATVKVYGQDYNSRSYAVAAADLLIKGQKDSRIELGNTLTDDRFADIGSFDYLLANPPFGLDWRVEKREIDRLVNFRGYSGKLPRINDGALLFLLHMISKFADYEPGNEDLPGSRAAIVFNGSPLFTGGEASGESQIRRWIIERDHLETIVALPEHLFYNTGIGTFIWIVTNRKAQDRKGKIQLIDARERWTPMKQSLGEKRRYLNQADIDAITREHAALENNIASRVLKNVDFGYRRINVLRPLRLRFQITPNTKDRFLSTCPELFDAMEAIEAAIGTKPWLNWNDVWAKTQKIVKMLKHDDWKWAPGAKGTAQRRIFRECFTSVTPEAEPVIAKISATGENLVSSTLFPNQYIHLPNGTTLHALLGLFPSSRGKQIQYMADPNLKSVENIPLKEDIISYFLREVQPYVSDAWIDCGTLDEHDGGIGKVGYEINFNRVFFQYKSPRSLREIDEELSEVEQRITNLLRRIET